MIIGILYGGISNEREVSLRSGKNVEAALKRLGYNTLMVDTADHQALTTTHYDVGFIALHGKHGEDGIIQGYLDYRDIPYTGSGVLASATAMHKVQLKDLMRHHNLPTADYQPFSPKCDITFPRMVKPIEGGSSIGVYKLNTQQEWDTLYQELAKETDQYFAEAYIEGKEITIGILEKDKQAMVLPSLELRTENEFYDYDAKYTKGKTEFILPATISQEHLQEANTVSLKLHTLIGCKSFSRIDMIVHPTTGPSIMELNTIPGLTDTSDIPAQAKAMGIEFDELIELILKSAL